MSKHKKHLDKMADEIAKIAGERQKADERDAAIEADETEESVDVMTEVEETADTAVDAADETEEAVGEDEAADKTEAEADKDEADDETEAAADEDEADDETEAADDEDVADDETEAAADEDEADEDEADDETEAAADEDEADNETEAAADEDVADDETEAAADEDEADDETEEAADEDEADDETEAAADEDVAADETEEIFEEDGDAEPFEDSDDVDKDDFGMFDEAEFTADEEADEDAEPDDEDEAGESESDDDAAEDAEDEEDEPVFERIAHDFEGDTDDASASPLAEEVDEDDYLDYDDEPRPKKLVSGRTAAFTMLLTALGTIAVIVGSFLFVSGLKKDMGVSLVSFSDKFNACNTNTFTYGTMLGIDEVSYSDVEATITAADIKALQSGKSVTKFDGMATIQADVRFGQLVTMDITFDPAINETTSPSGTYMMLVGNILSGLYPEQVADSDEGFMLAYTVIGYATPDGETENLYRYQFGDIGIFMDHTKVMESGNPSDLSLHIENVHPNYIDTSKLDWSWLPLPKAEETTAAVSGTDSAPVSGSDAD